MLMAESSVLLFLSSRGHSQARGDLYSCRPNLAPASASLSASGWRLLIFITNCAPMYACVAVVSMHAVPEGGQKRASDHLALELTGICELVPVTGSPTPVLRKSKRRVILTAEPPLQPSRKCHDTRERCRYSLHGSAGAAGRFLGFSSLF